MTYTAPTSADIKARFPEFAAVADATVDAVLAEAGLAVTDSWIEDDRRPAVMYYTAHELIMAGQGTSAQAKFAGVGDFSRIKSGDLEVSRGSQSGSGDSTSTSDGTFALTHYGKKFLELRGKSFPPFLFV